MLMACVRGTNYVDAVFDGGQDRCGRPYLGILVIRELHLKARMSAMISKAVRLRRRTSHLRRLREIVL